MTTLCDLAARLPVLIGRLLDREAMLKRGRFREETMTDIVTGSLAAFAGPELVIEYPIEADTGGDLDLRFWHAESGRDLHLRLQAKRLCARMDGKKPVAIGNRSYRELLHRPNALAPYQYETLLAAPAPWLPLYMFYNHQSVADDPYFASVGPRVHGINLAFAHDIAHQLRRKVLAAKAKPRSVLHHKRLSHLRPYLFGLEAILCPGRAQPGDGGPADGGPRASVPTPMEVSASLIRRWRARAGPEFEDDDRVLRILTQPGALDPARRPHRRVADGPAIRVDQSLERPVITFISGRTRDSRTPRIGDELAPD